MKPEDVPDELIHIAQEAWHTAPQKRDGKPTRMRYALAAAWPEITRRYRVALNAANAMERVHKRIANRYRERAERAEATVERVRALAQAAKDDPLARLRVMFGGAPAPALVHADDVLAALTPDQPEEETP